MRLEHRHQFLGGRHRGFFQDTSLGLHCSLIEPWQHLRKPPGQPPRRRVVAGTCEGLEHPPALRPGSLRHGDQPPIRGLQGRPALIALAAGDPVQLLRQPPDGADPAAERLIQPGGGLAECGLGTPQQPRDDPHAVADQAAVGGEVDVRLHRRGVDPQLTPARHLERPGELDDTVVQGLERLGADRVGPSDQGGVVGDALEVDAAELPQDQAIVDEVLGLRVAPAIQGMTTSIRRTTSTGVEGRPRDRDRGDRRAMSPRTASRISSSSSRRSSCSSWGSNRRPSWGTRAKRSVRLYRFLSMAPAYHRSDRGGF